MKRSGLPRLFVALYDYDPVTQSPNEDAADVSISLFTTIYDSIMQMRLLNIYINCYLLNSYLNIL